MKSMTSLKESFAGQAKEAGATEEEIAEITACTSLMNTNNVFYRFRHFMGRNIYNNNQPAGIKMSIMMNPVLGKEFFELVSLVVSSINGCEMCVTSMNNRYCSTEVPNRVYLKRVKLGAVIKGLISVLAQHVSP